MFLKSQDLFMLRLVCWQHFLVNCFGVLLCLQNDLSNSLAMDEMDASNGVNFPYYDPDTKMVYLVGKVGKIIN